LLLPPPSCCFRGHALNPVSALETGFSRQKTDFHSKDWVADRALQVQGNHEAASCDVPGIEHPIIASLMGPDQPGPDLVAALSNAVGYSLSGTPFGPERHAGSEPSSPSISKTTQA
jgi:hypothetical protein